MDTSSLRSGALPAIGERRKYRSQAAAVGSTPSRASMLRTASFGTIHSGHDTNQSLEDDSPHETPEEDEDDAYDADADASSNKSYASHTRRRFHSSDVVLREHNSSFHSRGVNSPTLILHQWIANGGVRAPVPMNDVSPAQFVRQYQRRRALSSDLTQRSKAIIIGGRASDHRKRRSFDREKLPLDVHNAILEEITQHDDGERDDNADEFRTHSDSDSESDDESTNQSRATRSRRTGSEDSIDGSSVVSGNSYHAARSYESTESMEKLRNLQKLYQEGFITVTEYKDRRLQLVDEMTATDKTIHRTTDLIQTSLPVVHREPPDFTVLRERDAIKHVFDSEKRKWTSSRIKVKIDAQPFGRGGLRQVFHLQDLSVIPRLGPDGRPVSYVAKIAIDVNENPDTYFRDVEMQAVASKFAKLYNSYNPPRRVEFLDAWILQLVPLSNSGDVNEGDITMHGTICGVEPYIAGEYHKHNNNFGYVSDLERNTPQAFSHFTYEASGREMLIVDIQGVADHYTDPQIHTRSGKEFGKGNLAVRGFERFLESHRCNPICRYLKLPLNNPKDDAIDGENGGGGGNRRGSDAKGTVPAQPFMSQPRIRVNRVDSELCHYYGDSTAFKKYQAKHHQQNQQVEDADAAASAFVAALKEQRNCSSFCGVGLCSIS